MRYSANDNYQQLVNIANDLKIHHFGVSKRELAARINQELDFRERKANQVDLNLIDASEALTYTELGILVDLINKVKQHKFNVEVDAEVEEMIANLHPHLASFIEKNNLLFAPNVMFGQPGVGKSKTLKYL